MRNGKWPTLPNEPKHSLRMGRSLARKSGQRNVMQIDEGLLPSELSLKFEVWVISSKRLRYDRIQCAAPRAVWA